MSGFLARADFELERMPESMLIAYVRDAHAAGRPDLARRGLGIAAERQRRSLIAFVAARAPWGEVRDIVGKVLVNAAGSDFRPASGRQLTSWLQRVALRRIADLYEERRRKPAPDALPEAGAPGEPSADDGRLNVTHLCARIEDRRRRASLKPAHRAALILHVDLDLEAADAAARVPGLTADNVAQIKSRHRREVTRRVDGGAAA